jgi:hypothetical protein
MLLLHGKQCHVTGARIQFLGNFFFKEGEKHTILNGGIGLNFIKYIGEKTTAKHLNSSSKTKYLFKVKYFYVHNVIRYSITATL